MLHTKQTQAFFIFCFYQVEWCCNTCTVHSLQCMGWLLFKRLHWPQRQMEVKLQGDRSGDVPIISVNYRNSHLLPCLGNTEISSDSAQWETPALPISVRCEALVHFANHLQFPWEEMCAARHKASRLLSQHDTALQSCFIPSSGTAHLECSVPLSPSHLCLWRPSHQAARRSRGCWARACRAWQPCAPMTCSSPGQCLSEQTSASSSSERTSCCCSEPPYEASLAQNHKHVITCISCSHVQDE